MAKPGFFSSMRSGRRVVMLSLIITVMVAALVGLYFLGRWYENRDYKEERQQMTEGFGRLPTVEYDGKTYVKRSDVNTVLLMGIDRAEEDTETLSFRDGGQADFLMVLAIDHTNKQIHQLQLDRDSITDVPVVGVLGNEVGTRRLQICLSHAYGGNEEQRCQHTMQAVANLLGGEKPGHCISVWLGAIHQINSALGGITLTVPDDYSHLDPAMTKGAVLTLTDAQAEILVRSRMSMTDDTNAARMERQRSFLSAVLDKVRANLSADINYAGTLFDILDSVSSYTTVTRGQLINEVNQSYHYDILPVETLTGEYKTGSNGYMEFHVDDESIASWVLQTLYEPKN